MSFSPCRGGLGRFNHLLELKTLLLQRSYCASVLPYPFSHSSSKRQELLSHKCLWPSKLGRQGSVLFGTTFPQRCLPQQMGHLRRL
ncbi:hypothetical protein ACMD2_16615 [Ananas comosus]|uniref:Uncharacterized protein n=1 Tax=Ananas comosus TaxID=4615 RepID=A0A199V6C9_ANACO|nr:hypothetical protein ACMD2_16615 [Ananas comosus]